jgi:L-ascorbate metabolism protein UlaG (beta-lactamase superfamily)
MNDAAASHFDGHRYFNPAATRNPSFADLWRLFRAPRSKWPSSVPVIPKRPAPLGDSAAVVTFIGHATTLLQTRNGTLLTDPVWSQRASPVPFAGPRRVRQPGVRFEDLPHVDVVLLSHNHYDHCDLSTLRRVQRRWNPLFVTPLGNERLLRKAGAHRIESLDWWQTAAQAPMPIMLTPAQHFSARTPFDRNRMLWGSFIVDAPACRMFFGGDTGYGKHLTQVRERCGTIDLALLPIGAYEPRWFMRDIHMDPAEAVQAHIDLASRQSVAIHFGTFQLTPEAIDAPVVALGEALAQAHVTPGDFRVLECGESMTREA